ncbi:MAG: ATP-grasp domain-containing protein, partial [bacterium]|nr:ATP-grasp domain-containing protein [bacterium]
MSRRKRILLFASTTGYQTRVFAQTARKMGLDLVLATDRCRSLDDPWGDQAVPVKFDLPSEAGRLEARFGAGAFDGVAAVGDGPALLAALVAERFGLPFHTGEGAAACRDKFIMRERFRAAGLPVPKYRRLPLDQDPQPAVSSVSYPCVLKPLGLSASRGVIRANDAREFGAAFHRIQSILGAAELRRLKGDARNFLQVEDYIEGREFALEGLVTGGELQVLALFDKPDPLDGPYFEETIYVTPSREPDSVEQRIVEATRQSVETLGLRHGPVHAEMRVHPSGVWMLEVAARPIGGLCAAALRFAPDMTLEELIIRHALGEDVTAARLSDPSSGVMMIPIPAAGIYQGVQGVDDAVAVEGIYSVVI